MSLGEASCINDGGGSMAFSIARGVGVFQRGQFVTAAELKALDVESSKVIDLEEFCGAG